jgi:CRP-like cAMP-binding protein
MADQTGDEPAGNAAPPAPEDPLTAGRLAGRLTAGQLELLRRHGEVRPTEAGQVLFREGDRGYEFIVIVSGAVTVLDHQAGVKRVASAAGEGSIAARFAGEHLGRRGGLVSAGPTPV